MAFQFSEKYIEEYERNGYTIFRGILPASLIGDLRRACDKGRALAQEQYGPQAQRFQPVSAYDIEQKPFENYRDLPELRDAISRVLSPQHIPATLEVLGVLVEPAGLPYCTAWHRDWRDNAPGLDVAEWEKVFRDRDLFNQVNCALYEDTCTWVVPGSHTREDTASEHEHFSAGHRVFPDLEGLSAEGREERCLEYCQSMPNAQRLLLNAGDYALYRNSLWHMGNYVPYKKRATLHDAADTPRFQAWREWAQENMRKNNERRNNERAEQEKVAA